MERMNLNEAELTVTTQYSIDMDRNTGYDMTLSDYSDMNEFLCGCSNLFPEEKAPEYRYVRWENIPSILITREWLCPNFFDIREAMEELGEDDAELFENWCAKYGYDLRVENPYLLVAHYRNIFGDMGDSDAKIFLPDTDEDGYSYACFPCDWIDGTLLRQEIFGDDYD